MSYRILTQNGINNTNIDGARSEYFNSGMRDGIVKGAFNEGAFNSNSSNSIYLDTCELRIAGHRVVIDEPVYQTFSSKPNTDKRYAFIAQIKVDDNSNVDFSIIIQDVNTELIKNNLYATQNGTGTYQVEIGRFTLLTTGIITDVIRTIDVITGNGNLDLDYIRIGDVTTTMLDTGLDAEVDVENVVDESTGLKKTNFKFAIPKSAGSVINVGGNQVGSVNFTSDPQEQITANANNLNDEILNREQAEDGINSHIDHNATNIALLATNKANIVSEKYGFQAGYSSVANTGSATGMLAIADAGSSSGHGAQTKNGASTGENTYSKNGASVGSNAKNGDGFSGGNNAKVKDLNNNEYDPNYINAIQLGEGTNNTEKSLQIYNDNIYNANSHTLTVQNASVQSWTMTQASDGSLTFTYGG